jgi:hypothetical protein
METGAESNADNKMQLGPQTVMWQLRKSHIPKQQKQNKK